MWYNKILVLLSIFITCFLYAADKPTEGGGAGLSPFGGPLSSATDLDDLNSLVDGDRFIKLNASARVIPYMDRALCNQLKAQLAKEQPRADRNSWIVVYEQMFINIQKQLRATKQKVDTNTVLLTYLLGGIKELEQLQLYGPEWSKQIPPDIVSFINLYNSGKLPPPPAKKKK